MYLYREESLNDGRGTCVDSLSWRASEVLLLSTLRCELFHAEIK